MNEISALIRERQRASLLSFHHEMIHQEVSPHQIIHMSEFFDLGPPSLQNCEK
jgi:hypothetical protein